jgi:hypothetical protein
MNKTKISSHDWLGFKSRNVPALLSFPLSFILDIANFLASEKEQRGFV